MSKNKNKNFKNNPAPEKISAPKVQNVAPPLPAVSVIIPMYNAERYIKSCVESVQRQTLQNLEIICVDDCSTDKTLEIVLEMAKRDGRIRIAKLAQNSGGASEPRNYGMRLSRGKYIAFLDSDDMYTQTAMAELVTEAEKFQADVVHTEQVYFPKDDVIDVTSETKFETFSKENVSSFCTEPKLETDNLAERVQMYYEGKFFGWVHNKLYRRDFLMDKDLKFAPLRTSEDIVFYFFVICTAPRIVRVPNIIYIYRQNPNSITRKIVSIDESMHALTQLMIEGTKLMDDFMAKNPLFVQNPGLRQLPIDYLIQQHLIWTQRFYEKFSPAQLDYLVRKELEPYCKDGGTTAFFAYMYSAVHFFRQLLINKDKKISELEAKLNSEQKN